MLSDRPERHSTANSTVLHNPIYDHSTSSFTRCSILFITIHISLFTAQFNGARVDGGLARGGRGVRGLRDAAAGAAAGLPRCHAGR